MSHSAVTISKRFPGGVAAEFCAAAEPRLKKVRLELFVVADPIGLGALDERGIVLLVDRVGKWYECLLRGSSGAAHETGCAWLR
jgi:hypothetical protein